MRKMHTFWKICY